MELTQIMRQKEDKEFAKMLCRIRLVQTSPEDIEELQHLNTSMDPNLPLNAVHTFATNKTVDAHNAKVLRSMNAKIYAIPAVDSTRDVETGHIENVSVEELPTSRTANLKTTLQICLGAKVMITSNIDVSDGLVNGSTGVVTGFIEDKNTVSVILVKMDNAHAGQQANSKKLV